MGAQVSRGILEYSDERGSYRIPIGRRSRKCLAVLDRKEGEYIRSLELDLFTGFVYYCVDNETSGGLSYYYDMTSKKVGHYFIHRYLRTARNHGFSCSAQETEIFEKLPCENWAEEMEKLPGWKEAIENRVENLLLPGTEVLRLPAPEVSGAEAEDGEEGTRDLPEIRKIVFREKAAALTALKREFVFELQRAGDKILLRHRNESAGNEFFRENEEFDLFLTDSEYAWIRELAAAAAGRNRRSGPDALLAKLETVMPQREELIMEEVCITGTEGGEIRVRTDSQEQKEAAETLRAAMTGLLRRAVELV